MRQKNGIRTVLIVLAAAVLITGVLVTAFFLNSVGGREAAITLPSQTVTQSPDEGAPQSPFLELTPENVSEVIETLRRPATYRQTVSLTTAWEGSLVQTVERTVGVYCTAVTVTSPQNTMHYLTDGATIYLWYEGDRQWLERDNASITEDDLAHIPTYEDVAAIPSEQIEEVAYRTESDGKSYLYVSCLDGEYHDQYWIDLETGLLARAETVYQQVTIYTMRQTQLTILDDLADDDSAFALPDGTKPFLPSEEQEGNGGN
jgi:hypothetical protein